MEFNSEEFETGKVCSVCGRPIKGVRLLGQEMTITCECVLAQKAREDDEKKKWEREQRIERLIRDSGIPPKQRKMSFDNYVPRPGTEKGLAAAQKWTDKYITGNIKKEINPMKKGLIFGGPCGCGKTHLACAIANKLLPMGVDVKFVRLADLYDRLRATYDGAERESEVMNEYKEVKLLIVDDVGTTATTEWSASQFHTIIDGRMNYELPTILTTNLTLEELSKKFDTRTVDRFKEGFFTFYIEASSYRQESK